MAGILGGDERIVALGVNWYLNRNIRIMLDDNIVKVSKGTAAHLPDRDSQDINSSACASSTPTKRHNGASPQSEKTNENESTRP